MTRYKQKANKIIPQKEKVKQVLTQLTLPYAGHREIWKDILKWYENSPQAVTIKIQV